MFYSCCTKRSQVCLHCQVDRATEHHIKIIQSAKANILKAQEKYKEQYDCKHCHPGAYQVGAKVLLRDFTRRKRKGGKMDLKWCGPYTITKCLGKGLYALRAVDKPHTVVCRVSRGHLKPYCTPTASPTVRHVNIYN